MRRSGPWMLAQLDFATRAHHVHADAGRMALLGGPITRARYEEFLARLYAFEAPVERRWQEIAELGHIVELAPRLRTGFLVSDLTTLGVAVEPPVPAPFVGVEQALGWMYVVERGRRLNALLLRHLARRLPREITIAGNYLAASSPCGARWQQLGAALDRYASDHVIAEQIINAAQRAFRSLRQAPRAPDSHAA